MSFPNCVKENSIRKAVMGSNPVSTTYWQLSIIGAGEKQNVQIAKLGHIVNVKSNWFWLRRNIFF